MRDGASNQELIDAWRQGDEQAAQVLVQRYMARLTALARSRLSRKLARRLDPEDVVLSAWRSFFVATGDGRVAVPADDNLWPLLVTMTLRKLYRQVGRHGAQRRGAQLEVSLDLERDWHAAIARDPSPEEAALLVDEVEVLMATLDASDREVLTRRLQGEDQATIATALHCSERSVRRAMQRIRATLTRQAGSSPAATVPGNETPNIQTPGRQTPGKNHPPTAPVPNSDSPLLLEPEVPTISYAEVVLQELVGQGGFGKVYRAVRSADVTTVAVKYLKKRFWKDPRATRNLLDETLRVRALSHPNIIRHHGWGRSPRGAVFVVMEWVDGTNLRDWGRGTHPSLREILQCGTTVASAVAAAHAAGVLHGDLTPANVLRRRDGTFILTDFGFARSLNNPAPARPGGTPGFLAPEQISEAFGPVSERTDVYGLGGLVYSLLTGTPPMTGEDLPEILANVISSRPPAPPRAAAAGIPPELDRLMLCCLSKEPSERPSSAKEVEQRLGAIVDSL